MQRSSLLAICRHRMTIDKPDIDSVKKLAMRGVFWTALEIFIRFGFQFGTAIILARLLTPNEFGIVALALVFSGLAGILVESGFTTAVVQQRHIDEQEISTIFHLQWLIALLVGCGLGLLSPWIAQFCGYPVLQPLIWTMALTLLVNTLGGIHASLLSRSLNFRPLVVAGLISAILGGALAIFLAFQGFGVWALAAQALAAGGIGTAILWMLCPWRPQMVFRPELLKRSFKFGGFVFLIGLSDAIYGRLFWLAIGKIYGASDLAQYNRAEATQGVPLAMLTGVVSRVGFSAFAAVKDDAQKLRAGIRKTIILVMAVSIPTMFGLLTVAEPLVLTLFGEVWRPSVPLLRIVCLAGLVWPLYVINFKVLLALGHSRLCFQIEVVKKSVGIVCTLAALPFGLEALAWSQLIFGIVCYAIHAHYTKRLLGYGGMAQLWDCLPWLSAGAFMACSVWLLQFVLSISTLSSLIVQVVFGAILYLAFWLAWDFRLLKEIVWIVIPGRYLN